MLSDQFLIETLPLGVLDQANRERVQQHRLRRSPANRTFEKMNRHTPQFSRLQAETPPLCFNTRCPSALLQSLAAAPGPWLGQGRLDLTRKGTQNMKSRQIIKR